VNDFATVYPNIVKEWDFERNTGLTPQMFISGSKIKVWWECSNCHSSWLASMEKRGQGRGCPICKGKKVGIGINDLATVNPKLADEWNYSKNGDLTPQMVTLKSGKEVWWQCKNGHEWKAKIANRSNGSSCPICNVSRAERLGYALLTKWKIDFLKEYRFTQEFNISHFQYDFYLPKHNIIIEFDGEQHFREKTSWITDTPFKERIRRDKIKNTFAFQYQIPILRIPYTYDAIEDEKKIAELIQNFIKTKYISQEIIDFYNKFTFSNYATLALNWNESLK